jgi:hypothetical protein
MTTLKARRNQLLSHAIAALLMTGASTAAFGQTMTLQNNQLQIAGGSGTTFSNQTPTISTAGVVQTVLNVPSTNGVGIPSFNFTILPDGINNGTYDFTVGVTFVDANVPNRRMEAEIGQLRLTVTDGVITGTIPGSQSLRVLGRNGGGTLQVAINVTNNSVNGPVTVTGGTVALNAANLISEIRASHNLFDTVILAEFNQPATYDYRIVVQQTASSTGQTIQFGTGPTFNDFPMVKAPGGGCTGDCVENTTAFALGNAPVNELASDYISAYTVSGRFNVVTVSSGGGGTTTPVTDVGQSTTQLTSTLNSIIVTPGVTPSAEVVTQLNTAVTSTNNLLSSLSTQLSATGSTVSVTQALTSLTTANSALEKAGTATQSGGAVDKSSSINAIDSLATVLGALGSRTLTAAEKTQVSTIATTTVTNAIKLITSDTPSSTVLALVDAASKLLKNTSTTSGTISTALVTELRSMASTASTTIIATLPASLKGNVNLQSVDSIRALATASPTVTRQIALASARSCEFIPTPGMPDRTPGESDTSFGQRVANWKTFINNIRLEFNSCIASNRGLAPLSVVSAISESYAQPGGSLFAASEPLPALVNTENGSVINYGNAKYSATSTGLLLVPNLLNDGVQTLPDGRFLAVSAGNAMELTSAPLNVSEFLSSIALANYAASLRTDGSVSINLGNSQRFTGAFALDNLGTASTACSSVSFTEPTGAPTAAGHVYRALCANGPQQRITPYPDNVLFYTTIANAGLEALTDRNTGIIQIKNLGNFRPSFFASALSTADQTYLNANKNADGVAFRAKDANGDGRMDYEFLTSTGVQLFYGLP